MHIYKEWNDRAKYGVEIGAIYAKSQAHWLPTAHLEKLLRFACQSFQNSKQIILWKNKKKTKKKKQKKKGGRNEYISSMFCLVTQIRSLVWGKEAMTVFYRY